MLEYTFLELYFQIISECNIVLFYYTAFLQLVVIIGSFYTVNNTTFYNAVD